MTHIVVIGAGQAGASLVAKLRSSGFEGEVTLIGAEPSLPYQRPPLSKGYLLGELERERLLLRPASFYQDQNINVRLDEAVVAINKQSKTVSVGNDVISYDQLALTTGSEPRRLPASIGGEMKGVHVVRTLADVDEMSASFQADARALIVGGGYIGLEAAAVATKCGVKVTLVEMADRILQRVASPETSDYFRALHTSHGVQIREGIGLDHLIGTDGAVSAAILSDGSQIDIDFVIAGVGITPSTALAKAAGLKIDNGIEVDEFGRTSDPSIWAAGDCTSFPYLGGRLRLESVPNAIDQAECVAANMLGAETPYVPRPWFWSDQYDVKLQIAGLNTGYDQIVTRKGDEKTVSFWYYRNGTLLAVDAMNDPRAFMIGKRLIEAGKSPAPDMIANPENDLKPLLRA